YRNCFPAPCTGPYNQPGTATDADLGPAQTACSGGTCTVDTTFNTLLPGFFKAGQQAVIQVFRVRINDSATHTLFAQQGIFADGSSTAAYPHPQSGTPMDVS